MATAWTSRCSGKSKPTDRPDSAVMYPSWRVVCVVDDKMGVCACTRMQLLLRFNYSCRYKIILEELSTALRHSHSTPIGLVHCVLLSRAVRSVGQGTQYLPGRV